MRYAIFDLDGTITNSMYYWKNFGKYFLLENGYADAGELIEIEQITGTDWVQQLCDYFLEHHSISVTPKDFMKWGMDFMHRRYGSMVGFKPGAKELLDKLKAQGAKLCLCSATDRELMEPALERLDLDKYFEFTIHCRRFGMDKNNPEIFKYCMTRLGAENPGEVAVFEDSLYAASTAHSAGFYTVGMYDPAEANPEEMKKVCDQYVTDYAQLNLSVL